MIDACVCHDARYLDILVGFYIVWLYGDGIFVSQLCRLLRRFK